MKLSTFIYITTFLDGIDDLVKFLAFFACIGSIIAFIAFLLDKGGQFEGEREQKVLPFLRIRYWLPAFAICALIAAAIPPKAEMYSMYGADMVSKMAESPELQKAGKDTQEIVHSLSVILKGVADEQEKKDKGSEKK